MSGGRKKEGEEEIRRGEKRMTEKSRREKRKN